MVLFICQHFGRRQQNTNHQFINLAATLPVSPQAQLKIIINIAILVGIIKYILLYAGDNNGDGDKIQWHWRYYLHT